MQLLSDFGTSANFPVNRPRGIEVLILYMKVALPRLPGLARSYGVSTSSSV
jgi:hypothetical protein